MQNWNRIGWIALIVAFGLAVAPAWARPKTGTLEKEKVDGETVEVFTDRLYGYTLKTPKNWDFKLQKEKGDEEPNPLRLDIKCKDKQLPDQLWESPSAVITPQIFWFVFAGVDLSADAARDSIFSPSYDAEWVKPIYKYCEILRDNDYLNQGEITWGPWRGAFYSVQQQYTAQIPTGGGLFGSVSEVRLAELYVFHLGEHLLVIYLASERQFLPENREVVKELLSQIEPIED